MPLLRKTLDSDVTSGPIIEGMGLAAKRIRPALYQAHEFAGLAGVTIRTLHHYDRLGLLKPSRRTDAGYRLYRENDLVRLEQIIVLKFLGLPLKRIKELLDRKALDLPRVLQLQRRALEEKRRQLDVAIQAIGEAEQWLSSGRKPDGEIFKKVIKVIEMQNDSDWMMRYYGDEARAKVEDRKKLWSPELQEKVSKQWADLVRDIKAALSEDPASAKAQALAERWQNLVEGFTGGDRQIQAGLNAMYADRKNWPTQIEAKIPFGPEVETFIRKAMAARKRG